jgi:ATP-dependent DNA helicase PIF1
MRSLPGQSIIFNATDGGTADKMQRDKLLSSCMAPQSIELKLGSQVMLIKNIDESLVNGLLGKVIGFMDEKTFDIYYKPEDRYHASEDLDSGGESMDQSKEKTDAMLNKNAPGDTGKRWPVVRFVISDGTSRDLLCPQETWKIELPNGEIQASRSQIPLILAWALSIHKAQGQTLERVKVDLGRVFEKGQAYVALSRATCQEGLQVLRFDPAKVMAHEKVRNFYNKLYNVNEARKGHGFSDGDGYFEEEDELSAMAG